MSRNAATATSMSYDHERALGLRGPQDLANFGIMSRRFSIHVEKDYFNFASAHFLIFANGRREPLHGHNYQVSVAVEGELDDAGVLLNFITFKPLVKQVCDELDHRTLIQGNSPLLRIQKARAEVRVLYKKQRIVLPERDAIILPIANTSTELLAEYAANRIRKKVHRDYPAAKLRLIEVGIEESKGQKGYYRGEF